ncbi:Alkylated DNA repair protein AlkB [Microbacterium esteraromaticum]|uniref:Alkylated DNA repair protein AlkB n=1 Tax=Microbacterium esteraromaticum TaxID=57043 RepID=A0A1R4K789_9MICO|nr:alpha-ketoglutarate-dependent dioxygenase AlkB [Microbacterium esteraromaticum]SJN40200.1 Alkylated DNA repair protein AlkB [Microbacterium esteraromaticum]
MPQDELSFDRERAELRPGAVHVPDWLDADAQRDLLAMCREWARPPAGLREVRTPGGGKMSARQVCLGWHWVPYRYTKNAIDGDGAPVKPFPVFLNVLARRAVAEAYGSDHELSGDYDVAVINFYDGSAQMGMHRDQEETARDPVVSLTLGDACRFRFGNNESRTKPYDDVRLESGDLFVFGREARMAYHGVTKVFAGTSPAFLGLTGRVNVTLRVSGLQPWTAEG